MKPINYFITGLIFCIVGISGMVAGYSWASAKNNTKGISKQIQNNFSEITKTNDVLTSGQATDISASNNLNKKITPLTQIIYEYYYDEDKCLERTQENAPYFLIGLTQNELRNKLSDWDITKFSQDEIIMRKTVHGKSNQHFILGIQDGYLAVFYQEPTEGEKTKLKEITNTPINSLRAEEKERLANGIEVTGNENLIKILQDYES